MACQYSSIGCGIYQLFGFSGLCNNNASTIVERSRAQIKNDIAYATASNAGIILASTNKLQEDYGVGAELSALGFKKVGEDFHNPNTGNICSLWELRTGKVRGG